MLRRRLERLEFERISQLAAEAGRPFGFCAGEVIEEAMAFLSLPPETQQHELEALAREIDDVKGV